MDSDNESDDFLIHRVRNKKRRILSDSESEDDIAQSSTQLNATTSLSKWTEGNQPRIIPYIEIPGFKPFNLRNSMKNSNPEEFYKLLVTDKIFDHIVHFTNLNAEQMLGIPCRPPVADTAFNVLKLSRRHPPSFSGFESHIPHHLSLQGGRKARAFLLGYQKKYTRC